MLAARLVAPRRFELERIPLPAPGVGQVRVRLDGCGVCASNLPVWSGRPWFSYPLAPGQLGHEGWGTVEALGAGVDQRWLGRRVATLSDRSFAEFDSVAVDDLIPLPAMAPDLAPLEPFGCVFNVFDRARIAPGNVVAVIGLGFIGLGVARLAAQAEARVLAVSSNPQALAVARQFGAEVVKLDDRNEARGAVDALTGGRGCDVVVECTGHQLPLDLAGDVVAEGGRLAIAGFHQDGTRSVDLQQWNWKGIDVINAHERSRARIKRGMMLAAEALAADHAWAKVFVTHRLPLSRIGEALEQASERPVGYIKGAVLSGSGEA
ncbi:MAG: MDR/zinc-dependent alcohol dehydrogenase-like family protein [Pseudomonadales bacterium]